jgi:allantoinase
MAERLRAVRSRRVVTPRGLVPALVRIAGGRIEAVEPWGALPAAGSLDAGELVVAPGLVDTHVHVDEPGRTEWEGFATATRAAAAGGVTTLVDMPLNSIPPTTDLAGLGAKRAAAEGRCRVDVGFWGGLVPGNGSAAAALPAAGVLGFKAFLVDSGVPEVPAIGLDELGRTLRRLPPQLPVLVHAEDPEVLAAAAGPDSATVYATYLATRPPAAEVEAIRGLLALCRQRPFRLHVVHLATAAALPLLRAARRDGLPVSVETCPHYLTFAAEEIPDGATDHKCAPPIRERAEREALWAALLDGSIDLVASDHSPCPPHMNRPPDFLAAWGGIASLQLLLPAVWTEARRRGALPDRLARWLSAAPAALAGLHAKGRLTPGADADLVIWDPDAALVVDAAALEHRHPVSPYHGRTLRGLVDTTILRGRVIYARGDFPGEPRGTLLSR